MQVNPFQQEFAGQHAELVKCVAPNWSLGLGVKRLLYSPGAKRPLSSNCGSRKIHPGVSAIRTTLANRAEPELAVMDATPEDTTRELVRSTCPIQRCQKFVSSSCAMVLSNASWIVVGQEEFTLATYSLSGSMRTREETRAFFPSPVIRKT